jgi:AraC-like DNA-binding protein/mannose-6-phosphate isomerase-like protein (cupin superfamily)
MAKPIQEQLAAQSAPDVVACARIEGKNFGCQWHFHPELELTLVQAGGTHRWIGDKITPLKPGDLTFVGSNLPHDYRNEELAGRPTKPVKAVNVQFHPQFLGKNWLHRAEMTPVQRLFQQADSGLEITGATRDRVASTMVKMLSAHGLKRLILLMQILDDLATSDELIQISTPGFSPEINIAESERMGMVAAYIQENINKPIYLGDVAKHIGISEVTFSHYFRSRTGKTFPTYLNELRISRVCRMLAETDETVSQIAWSCGFDSMANFLKHFKRIHGCTPKQYRQRVFRP